MIEKNHVSFIFPTQSSQTRKKHAQFNKSLKNGLIRINYNLHWIDFDNYIKNKIVFPKQKSY